MNEIISDVWRSAKDWDQELQPQQYERRQLWLKQLPKLEELRIPRWYTPLSENQQISSRQLHVFVDASGDAIIMDH